jgi:hypothetical protein
MGHHDKLIARARHHVQRATDTVEGIDATVRHVQALHVELTNRVKDEEARTRIRDPRSFAYSTVALEARVRAENLAKSLQDLSNRRSSAVRDYAAACDLLRALELQSRRPMISPPSKRESRTLAGADERSAPDA